MNKHSPKVVSGASDRIASNKMNVVSNVLEKGHYGFGRVDRDPYEISKRPGDDKIKLRDTNIQSPTLNVVLGLGGLLEITNLSV